MDKIVLCNYGCGQPSNYQLKNGKFCCSKTTNGCKETKRKISESNKLKHSGENNGMFGKHHNKESLNKISKSLIGKPSKKKGISVSKEAKEKCSKTVKIKYLNGYINPMKDRKHSKETKIKQSIIKIGKYSGEKSPCYNIPRSEEVKEKISKSENGKIITKESILKRKETMIKKGLMVEKSEISNLEIYYQKVSQITGRSIKRKFTKDELKKRGNAGENGKYHIDHMFSILEGFKNNIVPYIIGHEHNLDLIPWRENDSKKSKCSISLDELCSKIFCDEEINAAN